MSEVYAVILNYNSALETIALFENLKAHNPKVNILIVDNASEEADLSLLKKEINSQNLLLNPGNLGYAGGNNIGIKRDLREGAEFIWLLNPDIRVEKNTLQGLLSTLQDDRSLAAAGPRILKRENPEVIFTEGEKIFMTKECLTHQKNHNKLSAEVESKIDYDIDYIDGSCILINTQAIADVGLLPEEYFLYFEETDWCFKARKLGWKLAVNSMVKVYNLTSIKKETFHYYFMRNRLIFCKNHHPDFKSVRNYYFQLLLEEFANRFKGKYLRPYYKSRVKGLLSGIYRTF